MTNKNMYTGLGLPLSGTPSAQIITHDYAATRQLCSKIFESIKKLAYSVTGFSTPQRLEVCHEV